jgi:hypothetical protein
LKITLWRAIASIESKKSHATITTPASQFRVFRNEADQAASASNGQTLRGLTPSTFAALVGDNAPASV